MQTTQPITLNDFRSWLQGVEDMQEEGWIPNATQWVKIRQKIDLIEEQPQLMTPGPMYRAASPVPSGLTGEYTPQTPRVSTTFVPPPVPAHLDAVKTPDIDTSRGTYQTTFA